MGQAIPDIEFALERNTRLRPGIAVVVGERWRTINPEKTPIPGVPDIAIEVISPSERSAESDRKVSAYLQYGAQEVWQIFPFDRTVFDFTSTALPVILRADERVTSPLLPGWEIVISQALNS